MTKIVSQGRVLRQKKINVKITGKEVKHLKKVKKVKAPGMIQD